MQFGSACRRKFLAVPKRKLSAREHLNFAYDRFVLRFGYLNDNANTRAFFGDPDLPLLASLENYDEETKRATLIGVVFLFGLVNKNAILLVDYINQLRSGGTECREAICRAGAQRLRPILMTTLATILGMMPVAIGPGAGSELRAPMAVAIIGGLVTSTLLSLLIVPVVYASLRRARRSEDSSG
jgi:hypothetical protein